MATTAPSPLCVLTQPKAGVPEVKTALGRHHHKQKGATKRCHLSPLCPLLPAKNNVSSSPKKQRSRKNSPSLWERCLDLSFPKQVELGVQPSQPGPAAALPNFPESLWWFSWGCWWFFCGFFPPRIIAGILPWEPRVAGRCIAAGFHPPGEPHPRRPPPQSSARSDQRLSGKSPGSHGSAGILFYPNLWKKTKKKRSGMEKKSTLRPRKDSVRADSETQSCPQV